MTIYYRDDRIELHHGANLEILPTLADGSIDCVVTSPPYFGLRSYLPDDHPDKRWELGTEATPAEYVAKVVDILREVKRVLANDGTLWLNLGDSYGGDVRKNSGFNERSGNASGARKQEQGRPTKRGGTTKSLVGAPWRIALALQDDGWILRNANIWHKPNAMPDPARDRFASKYETVFMLSKSRRYKFNLDAIKIPSQAADPTHAQRYAKKYDAFDARAGDTGVPGQQNNKGIHSRPGDGMVNPGDVWKISTTPFKGAHFAAFPPKLVERCILAGSNAGDTVLDPFHGSGTSGKVALENGRRYVGVELSQDYLDLSLRTRLSGLIA